MTTASSTQDEIWSIQMLRGAAAGLVLVAHVVEHGARDAATNAVLLSGRFGVEIFFVISGFIIAHINAGGRFDPTSFAVRRLVRIAPLYWACTLLVFGVVLVAPALFRNTHAELPHLLRSLAFIPSGDSVRPGDLRPIFKLGWTLNYEMFFYASVLALYWLRSNFHRTLVLTVGLGSLAIAGVVLDPSHPILEFYANLRLVPFICGLWLAEAWSRRALPWPGARGLWLVAAAVAATVWFYQTPFDANRTPGGHFVMTLAAVSIVAAGLSLEGRAAGRLASLGRWMGDISYSLYLTHMFIVGAIWAALARLSLPMGVQIAIALAVAIPLALATAHVSYRLFERPLNGWARTWTRKRGRPAPAQTGPAPGSVAP